MSEPRRFTTSPPVDFWIDDDQFWVLGAIPAQELATLLDMQAGLSGEGVGFKEQLEVIKNVFRFAMVAESWDRFDARLADRSRPIDFNLLLKISNMLSGEVWAGKASSSLPPSTEPPAPDGPTSTDGAPPVESTPSEVPMTEVSVVDSPEPAIST